jgi:hypothetical protein
MAWFLLPTTFFRPRYIEATLQAQLFFWKGFGCLFYEAVWEKKFWYCQGQK